MKLIPLITSLLIAQTGYSKAKESILDQLERRLLEKEQDALSFSSEGKWETPEVREKLRFDGSTIESNAQSLKDLMALDQATKKLEQQTEYLASEVHTTKQKILSDAKINNLINISAELANDQEMALRALEIRLNGHLIYEQNATLGLWIPDKTIPLYQGPMQPGKHRIELHARVVRKANDQLPMQNDTYSIVNESFSFDVPTGESTKNWQVLIHGGQSMSTPTTAELKAIQ